MAQRCALYKLSSILDTSQIDFQITPMTTHNNYVPNLKTHTLKDGFFTVLIAIGTYGMIGFGRAYIFVQGVNKGASARGTLWSYLSELIFLFLSIPCFKISHLCFKLVYLLQQRRLRELGRQC